MDRLTPTPAQERALAILKQAIDDRAPAVRLLGPAGSGKTILIQWIVEYCGGPDHVILLSTTNAAAVVMSRACNAPCRTVASALRTHFSEEALVRAVSAQGPDGEFPTSNLELYTTVKLLDPEAGNARAIIVDECSMASSDELDKIGISLTLLTARARRRLIPNKELLPYPTRSTALMQMAALGYRFDKSGNLLSTKARTAAGLQPQKSATSGMWAKPEFWIRYAQTRRLFGGPDGAPTIIFSGDILQLGPVKIQEGHGHHHESRWFTEVLRPREVSLRGNVRAAKDALFASFMAEARMGRVDITELNKHLRILSRREINDRVARGEIEGLPLMIMGTWDVINVFNVKTFEILAKKYPGAWRNYASRDTFYGETLEQLLETVKAGLKELEEEEDGGMEGAAKKPEPVLKHPQRVELEHELEELLPKTLNLCVGYKLILMNKLSIKSGLVKNMCCTIMGLGRMKSSFLKAERMRRARQTVDEAEQEGIHLDLDSVLNKEMAFIECEQLQTSPGASRDVLKLAQWRSLHPGAVRIATKFLIEPDENDRDFDTWRSVILCRFDDGRYIICGEMDAAIFRRVYDPKKKAHISIKVAQRRQFPFFAAMAIPCHRAQGQTMNNVCVWLTERYGGRDGGVFGPGSIYVALSRAQGFGDVYVTRSVEPWHMVVDKGCVEIVERLDRAAEAAEAMQVR